LGVISQKYIETVKIEQKGYVYRYQKELASVDDLAVVAKKWQNEKKGMVRLLENGYPSSAIELVLTKLG
jgi:hypothetical protein